MASGEHGSARVDERAIIAALAVRVGLYAGYTIGAYSFFAFSLAVIAYVFTLGVALYLLGLSEPAAMGWAAFAGIALAIALVGRLEAPFTGIYHAVDEEARRAGRRLTILSMLIFGASFATVSPVLGIVFGAGVAAVSWQPALTVALLANAVLYKLHPLAVKARFSQGWIGFLEAGLVMLSMAPAILYLALQGEMATSQSLAMGSMALGYLTAGTMMLWRGFKSLLEG